jgi:hypothetical protein
LLPQFRLQFQQIVFPVEFKTGDGYLGALGAPRDTPDTDFRDGSLNCDMLEIFVG